MREKVPSCDTEPLLRRHSSPPFAAISLSAGSATHVQLQSENPEWKTVEMYSLFYLSTAPSNTVSRPCSVLLRTQTPPLSGESMLHRLPAQWLLSRLSSCRALSERHLI